jgi:hypothetical protein
MRKLYAGLILMFVAANAAAFNASTNELLSTIAMPLAVAAVSNVPGIQQTQLVDLVTALNQANVQPTQFVQVIRYVPVALTDANGQTFVTYVQEQTSQGVTGNALVDAIVQQLRTNYNITPQLDLNTPGTTLVVQNDYVPQTVLTQLGGTSDNALTLIALPLAVAAVADIAGVPQDQLANFVASLNTANVPPAQMIEVVRYVPVALVDNNGQTFVQYVQDQTSQGITGPALVPVIVQRLQTYYPSTPIQVSAPVITTAPAILPVPAPAPVRVRPPVVVVDQNYVPPFVVNRVSEVRQHPHGGPPGQIKKEFGQQTGAEVVHGERNRRAEVPRPMISAAPPAPQQIEQRNQGHGNARGRDNAQAAQPRVEQPRVVVQQPQRQAAPPPQAAPGRDHGNGKDHGQDGGAQGQQKDNGKGKDNKGKEKG